MGGDEAMDQMPVALACRPHIYIADHERLQGDEPRMLQRLVRHNPRR